MNEASPPKDELLALASALGEQLTYARELGIESVEAIEASSLIQPEPLAQAQTTSTNHPALARNAAATTAAKVSDTVPTPGATQIRTFDPATREQKTESPSLEESKMAKQPTKPSGGARPAPRETLFGEIAPQDDASLVRPNETLEDIRADITPQCMRCTLCCEGRTQVVNSDGNREARLMFVGEAPGADEDAQGKPFVGRAGQLLNKIIEAIGMKREDVFIGNVNRCRPANNRTPTLAEAKICKPFLLREINVVKPELIVVLGNTAMKNLLDTKEGITKLRGNFQDYRGIKVMPTFHPAYLLRDPSKKRETWEDMKKVRDYLDGRSKQ
ncbi:MAG: uracil-DNA glycosylase family protein [Pyrinomonadaceae bacterium]